MDSFLGVVRLFIVRKRRRDTEEEEEVGVLLCDLVTSGFPTGSHRGELLCIPVGLGAHLGFLCSQGELWVRVRIDLEESI